MLHDDLKIELVSTWTESHTALYSNLQRKQCVKITTGSLELDKLLGGGVETLSITEMYGEFRSGKSQVCHTLCVTAQMPKEMGGGNGKVAVIDTEGSFRPERIVEICDRYGFAPEDVLDNIVYARVYNTEQQMEVIKAAAGKMCEDEFRLLIIDSLTALFRTDYSGRGELSERQQKLGIMMAALARIADEFGIAVVVTNQALSSHTTSLFLMFHTFV